MAKNKSYNDIQAQLKRIESGYGANSMRYQRVKKVADKYLSNAKSASYEKNGFWDDGSYDLDKRMSRSVYSGKSDKAFARDEYKRIHKPPKSIYTRSESIRNGNVDEIYKLLKNGETKHFDNPNMGRNSKINGFGKSADGTRMVSVYWPGNDREGSAILPLEKVMNGVTIPAESYEANGTVRYNHYDINVDKNSVKSALSAFADKLKNVEENNWADKQMANKKDSSKSTFMTLRQSNINVVSKSNAIK